MTKKKSKKTANKSAKGAMRIKIEEITPARAKALLKKNTKNRRIKPNIVTRYAGQMRKGEWEVTGEAICFSREGVLLNGQHRLMACIESETPFTTAMANGVEPSALGKYDTGTVRHASDVLAMEGFSYVNVISSAVRTIKGIREVEDRGAALSRIRFADYVPHTEIYEFALQHQAILHRGAEVVKSPDARLVCRPASLFCALYFLFADINETRAEQFFDLLIYGEGLTRAHPLWVLRSTLQKSLADIKGKNRRGLSHPQLAAITAKAWNAWMLGKTVKVLRHGDNEPWPHITHRKKKEADLP